MQFTLVILGLTAATFAGFIALMEIGRRVGVRRLAEDPDGARHGIGVVEGAIFSILGLLLAFTFGGALERFDDRRHFIVEEANAIGTAYLRIDVVPAAAQPALRESFRRYLDARLSAYRTLHDPSAAGREFARADALQGQIWRQATAALAEQEGDAASLLLLPALNAMFDITTTRAMATRTHPPKFIYVMLFVLSLASALLAGFAMAGSRRRNWLHMLGFAASLALALYVVLDLEYPRFGFIRVDGFDSVLVEVRESMK